jgi:hypothetical protein
MLDNIFISLFSGLIGLLIGNRIKIESEAAARRRTFRDFIAILNEDFALEWKRAEMFNANDFENWDMLASHYASVPKVRAEAIKIREDIYWWKRPAFNKACIAYAGFGAEVNFETNHAKFSRIRSESEALLNSLIKYAY